MPLSREELAMVRELLGREPTRAELYMFEAQWSEHCSYKSSRRYLRLLPTYGRDVLVGPGRDAPAVRVFDKYAVVFKIESHNHPSAVDPYNGAATGVGGVVRDVLALGARPIALLDLLFLGNPRDPHASWLVRGVVKGISDYGNRIGVPVVAGMTWFDESYNRYPLVNVACIGVVEVGKLLNGRPEPGDLMVVVGNSTGRDGLLGSSFASKPLGDDESGNIAAIQVGNPLIEKLLIDVLTEAVGEGVIRYMKDLGGGGLATAVAETAADNGLGAVIILDSLHVREGDMAPEEVLVSESQERMLAVVTKENLSRLASILEKYELQYSVIGYLDSSGNVRVFWRGSLVADVPAKLLARPQARVWDTEPPKDVNTLGKEVRLPEVTNVVDAFMKVVTSRNVVSREWIYSQYDYEVGVRTVVKPGYGDAAVLRLMEVGGFAGIAVKGDGNPRYTYLDPFRGAANAVGECYRNLISVGSKPIAVVDELNAGSPEKPHHYWYFVQMVKGLSWMAQELRLPVVGGKVSFYNEDSVSGSQVKPVTTVVGVGVVEDVRKATTSGLKEYGDYILAVGTAYPELGGSELAYTYFGIEAGEVPVPRPSTELLNGTYVSRLIDIGYAVAVHDVSVGGMAVAIAEMCVKGLKGVLVDLSRVPSRGCSGVEEILFSETQGRYVIEVRSKYLDDVLGIADELGVDVGVVGTVTGNDLVVRYGVRDLLTVSVSKLRDVYENTLEMLMEGWP